MKNFLLYFKIYFLLFIIIGFFALGILTPEKDKYGNYTQLRYWYDSQYYEQNF